MTSTTVPSVDRTPRALTSADRAAVISTEIRELTLRISVATARLLLLIGEFDASEAWAGYGVKSCAHWLSWQCHVSLHTAREYVRIARRLPELPMITGEFSNGGLSYAKVRALTRVADADCEADLVSVAKAATATQVERVVAGWRRTETISPEERAQRRQVSWTFDDDGMLRLHARLDVEEGAILVAAIEAARAHLAQSADTPGPAESGSADGHPVDTGTADAEPASAHSAGASGRASLADALAAIATSYLAADNPACSSGRRVPTELVVMVDEEVLLQRAAGGIATFQSGGSLTEQEIREFACDTKLLTILKGHCDVLDVGRSTRTVPRRIRRALFARDRGCAVPGCTEHRPDWLHAHHVIHWADGGPTALDNLVLVCKAHHWAVHHDRLHITASAGRFSYRTADGTLMTPVPATPDLGVGATQLVSITAPNTATPHGSSAPTGQGDRFDLDYIVSVLRGRQENRRQKHHRQEQAGSAGDRLAA